MERERERERVGLNGEVQVFQIQVFLSVMTCPSKKGGGKIMRTHFMMMIKGVTAAVVISKSPRTRKVVSFSIWRRERTVRYEWKESNQEESNEWNQKEQVRKESGPKQNGRRRRHCVSFLLGLCFLLVTIKINLKDFRLLLFFYYSLFCSLSNKKKN